jgi:hypothetical protein
MPDDYKAAHELGHTVLYHYEKFNREWLTATLCKQRVFCSDPTKLNDPWDCKPVYDSTFVREPDELEAFIHWTRTLPERRPPIQLETQFENRLRTDHVFRNEFIGTFSTGAHSVIEKRRIYCLTPDLCSMLMWSHYGDSHRGLCLQFSTDNPLFRNAWKVEYSETYPRWAPHKMLDYSMAALLTKSAAWQYEDEFRILASPTYREGDTLMLQDEDFLKLPPNSLKAVIAGCRGDYEAVTNIVRQHAPEVVVKRMVQIPNYYRLVIEGEAEAACA